jgi:hypothetical protein
MKKNDLLGGKYGRLSVIGKAENSGHFTRWLCVCECGKTAVVKSDSLRRGLTRSCGCLKAEIVAAGANSRHGMRHTDTYGIWCGMKDRCLNPNAPAFDRYGGRGISICASWHSFENFLADMGPRPKGLSLDRIDNDGNYSPENCRWSSPTEQARNTRRNLLLTLDGETMPLVAWAAKVGLQYGLIKCRLRSGWSAERALQTPPRPCRRKAA